jgi:hypothetical protein
MNVNLPYKVRRALYVATIVGAPVVAYLQAKGIIGTVEVSLWLAEVTVISALAAFNVKK